MSSIKHNGIGTVMEDEVMSDISVWDCIQIIETDGKVSGLKIKSTVEKLLLQLMKANDDIEYLREVV